jgi:hypothetical protein
MARPKGTRTVDAGVYVRLTKAELDVLRRAANKQVEGVLGAVVSVPKFMLASSLKEAKRVLGEK